MPRLSVNWVRLGSMAFCAAVWGAVAWLVFR